MAIDALVAPLLKIELFRGLRPLQITEIARRAERVMFKPGQTLATADAPAEAALLIVSGEAERATSDGRFEPIPPGSLVCEMAMLVDTEYSSTIVAKTPMRVLRLTRAALYEQMADDARLADHMVSRITARLKTIAVELRNIDRTLAGSAAETFLPQAGIAQRPMLEAVRPGMDTRH